VTSNTASTRMPLPLWDYPAVQLTSVKMDLDRRPVLACIACPVRPWYVCWIRCSLIDITPLSAVYFFPRSSSRKLHIISHTFLLNKTMSGGIGWGAGQREFAAFCASSCAPVPLTAPFVAPSSCTQYWTPEITTRTAFSLGSQPLNAIIQAPQQPRSARTPSYTPELLRQLPSSSVKNKKNCQQAVPTQSYHSRRRRRRLAPPSRHQVPADSPLVPKRAWASVLLLGCSYP
jgi:hypothetical protein